jgi:hypothetical protein
MGPRCGPSRHGASPAAGRVIREARRARSCTSKARKRARKRGRQPLPQSGGVGRRARAIEEPSISGAGPKGAAEAGTPRPSLPAAGGFELRQQAARIAAWARRERRREAARPLPCPSLAGAGRQPLDALLWAGKWVLDESALASPLRRQREAHEFRLRRVDSGARIPPRYSRGRR